MTREEELMESRKRGASQVSWEVIETNKDGDQREERDIRKKNGKDETERWKKMIPSCDTSHFSPPSFQTRVLLVARCFCSLGQQLLLPEY
eukprot:762826-Hanusia_phi.AAC.4